MDGEEIYLQLIPIATSIGVGYEIGEGNWLKVTGYSIMTAIFLGENILRKLKKISGTIEERV